MEKASTRTYALSKKTFSVFLKNVMRANLLLQLLESIAGVPYEKMTFFELKLQKLDLLFLR